MTLWHAISRGNDGRQVFHDDQDHQHYIKLLGHYLIEYECDLFHFSDMPNHAHNMVEAEDIKNLSGLMQKLNQIYSRDYKEKYGGDGHLWRNRFKRYSITNDSYLQTCGVYIELNPVRAKLVEKPEDYAWSSCRAYLFDEPNPLIKFDPLFIGMGVDHKQRAAEYRKLLDMWMNYPVTKKDAVKFFKNGPDGLYPHKN